MDKFSEGTVCYHKATNKRCVVMAINKDGKIKVRTEADEERDYLPHELETQAERQAQWDRDVAAVNESNRNRIEDLDQY